MEPREIGASAAVALLAGALVWPPVEGLRYWTRLEPIGDAVVIPVAVVSVLLGAGFARFVPVAPRSFAVGATGAYLGAMGAIALTGPESPVHLVLYGIVLLGLIVGVGGVAALRGGDGSENEESEDGGPDRDPA